MRSTAVVPVSSTRKETPWETVLLDLASWRPRSNLGQPFHRRQPRKSTAICRRPRATTRPSWSRSSIGRTRTTSPRRSPGSGCSTARTPRSSATGARHCSPSSEPRSSRSSPPGEILKKLAVHADVLIENAPPGQFDAWGIGYRQLREINPRLVYAWVGQRGQWGPLKDKPGMLDPTAQAACGFVHGTGIPKEQGGQPVRSAMWMADHVGGTSAAMGILAALIHRDRVSGKGQFVEATGAEAVIRILDYDWAWYGMDGSIRPRYGNWDLAINIYAVNPCKDGLMMVGGGHDRLWYRIWKTVGKDRPELEDDILDDKKLRTVTDRLPHEAQVKTYTNLTEWMKAKSRAEAEKGLLAEEVASGGVLFVDEVAEYPQFKYRGHVREIDDPLYGEVVYAGSAFKGQKTPGRVKWLGRPVGYDNEAVYRRLLGFTRDDLRRLPSQEVI